MNEIFSNRPNEQLTNAEPQIKTYIQLLERKLKNCISLSNLNKDIKKKYLDLQEELKTTKIKQKGSSQQDELEKQKIQELQLENANLYIKTKQQQQQIILLQREIQQLKNNSNRNNSNGISYNSISSLFNAQQNHQPNPIKELPTAAELLQQQQVNNVANSDPAANSILVKGFVEQQLNAIPKINIINLGRSMNIEVVEKDIIKVSTMERKFYERHNLKPNKIILIVQLRTPELKVEFLKNKEKLKQQSDFEDIEIIDYVTDDVYNLYQYAKILKGCGYALIYWRNNRVYVKKTRSTLCEPILIKSKDDVETLKLVNKK